MESLLDNKQFKEREALYNSALKIGLPIVSRETCAIICAMLLVWGNCEMFTHNHRLVCELRYAQNRFKIKGSESPDAEFVELMQSYVSQLQIAQDREDRVPDHIDNLFYERYGFRFNKDKG